MNWRKALFLFVGLWALLPPKGEGKALNGWSVKQREDILEISYGTRENSPQYIALHLKSGYLRMIPSPQAGWGTSIIISPSFWDEKGYHQGTPIFCNWKIVGKDLSVDFKGEIASLKFEGRVRFHPPKKDYFSAVVWVKTEGKVNLIQRPGEAFKPVMLSSMRISSREWDCSSAYVDSRSLSIPQEGWIIQPPLKGKVFGLKGGSSDWKKNAPSVEIRLRNAMFITGWVTKSNDPNDDNVGFWCAETRVLPSWEYDIIVKP